MSTQAARKRALTLVPKPDGAIDADMVAFTVMEYIDTNFPTMWLAQPQTARVSIRNTIVRAVRNEEKKL